MDYGGLIKGITVAKLCQATRINRWFLEKIKNLAGMAKRRQSKRVYKMVDTCSGEFPALTPYFYSIRGQENEAESLTGPKAIILGSGPIRIGQGIEFDYMCVHAVKALKQLGIKSIIVNNNPETVSTDYATADRLYFEPLTSEYVKQVVDNESQGLLGIIDQFGGQTALNLAVELQRWGIGLLGTQGAAIEKAEDRSLCAQELKQLGLRLPRWKVALNRKELMIKCQEVGFPLLVRPSYVLAGEGMLLAENRTEVLGCLETVSDKVFDKPVLVDEYIKGAIEVDVDFISDGLTTAAFVLEQVEPTGIHSGDSACWYPAQRLDAKMIHELERIASRIAAKLGIVGLGNIQAAVKDDKVWVLEVNPRASRTIPFLT